MDAENIFDHIEGNPENVVIDPLETIDSPLRLFLKRAMKSSFKEPTIKGTSGRLGGIYGVSL
jgi:hypothetical protein